MCICQFVFFLKCLPRPCRCIAHWTCSTLLGSKSQFHSQFGDAISKGIKRSANASEIALANRAQQSLREVLKEFMLRREKSLIADQMPTKEDVILTCPMTALQEKLYRNILDSEDGQRLRNLKQPCACGSRNPHGKCCGRVNSKGQTVRDIMFKIFSALVKIANHVDLIKVDPIAPGRDKAAWQEDLELARIAFATHEMQQLVDDNKFLRKSDDSCSAKMKVLASLLRVWLKKNNKILIFSGSTKLLDIVDQMLIRIGTEYSRLDGNTPIRLRSNVCTEFNTGQVSPVLRPIDEITVSVFKFALQFTCEFQVKRVMLLSTKAGGLGLNLTGANIVVVLDPNWNPRLIYADTFHAFEPFFGSHQLTYQIFSSRGCAKHLLLVSTSQRI